MKVPAPITFGVVCHKNINALRMCLSSVLMQKLPVANIIVAVNGDNIMGDFYIQQLANLAVLNKISFRVERIENTGVRDARQFLLDTCATEFLWMGDDDCIYEPECLLNFVLARNLCFFDTSKPVAYLAGNKFDVANIRGYTDFSLKTHSIAEMKASPNFNLIYEHTDRGFVTPTHTLDTGNVFIDKETLTKECPHISFNRFGNDCNAGGEDTVFAMQCYAEGYVGLFVPGAKAVHLEKPQVSFNEFAARKAYINKAARLLTLPPGYLDAMNKEMMSWIV